MANSRGTRLGVLDDQTAAGHLVRDTAAFSPPVQDNWSCGRNVSRRVGSTCGPLREISRGTHFGNSEVPLAGAFRNHAVPAVRVFVRRTVSFPEICIVFRIGNLSRFLCLGVLEMAQGERLVCIPATDVFLHLRRVAAVEKRLAFLFLSYFLSS